MKAIKTSKKAQRRADKGLIRDAVANKGDARRQLLARLGHLLAGPPSRVEGVPNLRLGDVVTLTDADGTSRTMVVVDERGGLAPLTPAEALMLNPMAPLSEPAR